MFKKRGLLVLVVILAAGLVFGGCGGGGDDTTEEGLPQGINIATSAVGGTYHIWASGYATVLNDNLGLNAAVETGGGPVTNVGLIQENRVDIGLATMGPVYEGYTGTGWTDGEKHDDIRTTFPMFESYLHWWVLPDSGIESIYDFEGKNVCNGPSGSSPHLFGARVFEEFGIEPSRITSGHYSDVNQQMRDRQMDAIAAFSGLPNPAAEEMVQTEDCEIITVPKEEAEEIADKYGITVSTMSKDSYDTMEQDEETLTMWNTMIVNKDASEELVYEIVKTTFENLEEVHGVHASAKQVQLDNIKYIATVPLHKGAIKYYEEEGIDLPDTAYGPESE